MPGAEAKTQSNKMSNVKLLHRAVFLCFNVAVCQNLVPLVNIKIAGKWMFIPLKMVLIGIDPYPCILLFYSHALAPTYRETQIDTSFLTF